MIDPDAIADSEKTSRVFCTLDGLAPGARLMPDGFITSAHYQFNTTAGFVQVTGEIDRTKYSLSAVDGGGQVKETLYRKKIPLLKLLLHHSMITTVQVLLPYPCVRATSTMSHLSSPTSKVTVFAGKNITLHIF
jgi:hypothetical protein